MNEAEQQTSNAIQSKSTQKQRFGFLQQNKFVFSSARVFCGWRRACANSFDGSNKTNDIAFLTVCQCLFYLNLNLEQEKKKQILEIKFDTKSKSRTAQTKRNKQNANIKQQLVTEISHLAIVLSLSHF